MTTMKHLQYVIKEADDESNLTDDAPFAGLDLRSAKCFGYSLPETKNWKYIADQADDVGRKLVDVGTLERSLTKDVEDSYFKIAQFSLTNVDDDTDYTLWYDNNKALWGLSIKNSPKAEISIEERADFFKSDQLKKIAQKTYARITMAKKTYDNIIKPRLNNGELMLVDVIKLDAIISFIETEHFMDNLLNGKYLSY